MPTVCSAYVFSEGALGAHSDITPRQSQTTFLRLRAATTAVGVLPTAAVYDTALAFRETNEKRKHLPELRVH